MMQFPLRCLPASWAPARPRCSTVSSKSDLAAARGVASQQAHLNTPNPGVLVIQGLPRVTDAALILDLGPFRPETKAADVRRWLHEDACADRAPEDQHHRGYGHHNRSRHDDPIHALCLTFDCPLRWGGFGRLLEMLVATTGGSLLRVKALLNLVGRECPLVINGGQHICREPVLLWDWPAGDDRRSRLMFITRGLARSVIEDGIRTFEQAAAPFRCRMS